MKECICDWCRGRDFIRGPDCRSPKPRKKPKNPMQPVVLVKRVVRFKENKIVCWMLDNLRRHRIDLNEIAMAFKVLGKDKDDYQQLMQLIGYSVSGYGDLSTHDEDVLAAADEIAAKLTKEDE